MSRLVTAFPDGSFIHTKGGRTYYRADFGSSRTLTHEIPSRYDSTTLKVRGMLILPKFQNVLGGWLCEGIRLEDGKGAVASLNGLLLNSSGAEQRAVLRAMLSRRSGLIPIKLASGCGKTVNVFSTHPHTFWIDVEGVPNPTTVGSGVPNPVDTYGVRAEPRMSGRLVEIPEVCSEGVDGYEHQGNLLCQPDVICDVVRAKIYNHIVRETTEESWEDMIIRALEPGAISLGSDYSLVLGNYVAL